MGDTIIGLHDFSPEMYHADPCPAPSLSSSGIRTLLEQTPAHFAALHPKLTRWPEYARPSTRAQDLGTVVHRLVLGKGCDVRMIDLADFRNKDGSVAQTFGNADAKRAKAQAEADGAIVVDRPTFEQAEAIAAHAIDRLRKKFGGWPIGDSEVTGIWQRQTDHGPIWCRMLMDHVSRRTCTVIDLKTTGRCVGNDELAKKLAGDGADIQAVHYLDGITTLFPKSAEGSDLRGLWQFVFVVVEVEPPYDVRIKPLTENWLTRARFRVERASNRFAECLQKNEWPGWPDDGPLQPPPYLATKWEAEELEEAV